MRIKRRSLLTATYSWLLTLMLLAMGAAAQENHFVTYSHQMEEPGNLEIAMRAVAGSPKGENTFYGSALEFEYGVKAWWTTELYFDGQSTAHDSTVLKGFGTRLMCVIADRSAACDQASSGAP